MVGRRSNAKYSKYDKKLVCWSDVKLTINDYLALNGSTSNKDVEFIVKEIGYVVRCLDFMIQFQIDVNNFFHNKETNKSIEIFEELKFKKMRDHSFLKSIVGNDPDYSSEDNKINFLIRSKLEIKHPFSWSPDGFDNLNEFKSEFTNAIKNLNNFKITLERSLILAKQKIIAKEHAASELAKEKERKEFEKRNKASTQKALAAAHTNRTRQLAATIKKQLIKQRKIIDSCPYCGNELGEDCCADHIYPVAKGGLSTVENMIYVCKKCNQSKSDKALFEFIHYYSYDFQKITNNLKKLNKKF